jgi:solute carrier family 20 (sodium-dependent phosphate transporter)
MPHDLGHDGEGGTQEIPAHATTADVADSQCTVYTTAPDSIKVTTAPATAPDSIKANKAEEVLETHEEEDKEADPAPEEEKGFFGRLAAATYERDLEDEALGENEAAHDIWDHAEIFDYKSEQLFVYVQVFTACLNSFAHGANDVANAIAPLSSILMIYQTGEVDSKTPVEKWILVYGGLGIVVGLALYGYKVMKSIGFKVTFLTPSRGASAELAASLFVVTASFLGIPVSTTQCISGAVVGVGLVGGRKNVQWWFFLRVCSGWVIIFFVAIIVSAGIFSMFAFTPSLVDGEL